MARLVNCDGNAVLTIAGNRICGPKRDPIAKLDGRCVRTLSGDSIGNVTIQGRFMDGVASEVVVVGLELRDAMGQLLGRFEDATPVERGLLALVYGQLVTGR